MRKLFLGESKIIQMVAIALCLFLLSGPLLAEINTTVDRTRLAEGETLNLMLEVQGQVSGQPDTKPLEKDFEVLGTASGSQMTINNGAVDARTTWTISLQPKHSGTITIPILEIHDQKTTTVTVEVTKAKQADADSGADVFIETEVTPESPYVQGEVRYTIRIHHAVQLTEAELIDPTIDGAIIRKTEGDREYYKTINDRRYRVIERSYTLFPQSSGELIIPEAVLNARIRQPGQRNRSLGGFFGDDPFDRFSNSRSVSVRSKPHTLKIRPQPKENKGAYWLPAKQLSLSEEWDAPQDEIRVGEPITRTLEISALGLTAEQLPDLNAPKIKGVNSYPDQSQNLTQDTENGVVGQKTRRIAFVPTQPGKFTVPAMEIFWWDTEKDQQQRVELPERSFSILAAEGVAISPDKSATESSINTDKRQEVAMPVIPSKKSADYWPWVALALALLWLATLALWFRDRVSPSKYEENKPKPEPVLSSRNAQKEFKEACRANDPKAARNSLLKWAAIHWSANPPHGLSDLAERIDEEPQRQALLALNRALYQGNNQSWNGEDLGRLNIVFPKASMGSSTSKILPPLYPG